MLTKYGKHCGESDRKANEKKNGLSTNGHARTEADVNFRIHNDQRAFVVRCTHVKGIIRSSTEVVMYLDNPSFGGPLSSQEEAPRTVRINDEEVTIKVVKVEDSTSNCNVTLWRAAAAADVRPGDYIRVTDVIKTEVPVSERDVVVVGACVDGATVDLLLDDDTEVKGLVGEEDIEEASAAGLQVHITSQGPDIVSLELIEEALMLG
ncbi:hypothetical protein DPMN_086487 [Dreissena polymorpha]|uniref:Uncharacterized protein n=1 Tax=Dreissena polymorpha TaxID=45954 RepID=A0A9D4QUM4_DREPO|nr:hypothetical protein DPMN_086487 [Dreissena polymorpha]